MDRLERRDSAQAGAARERCGAEGSVPPVNSTHDAAHVESDAAQEERDKGRAMALWQRLDEETEDRDDGEGDPSLGMHGRSEREEHGDAESQAEAELQQTVCKAEEGQGAGLARDKKGEACANERTQADHEPRQPLPHWKAGDADEDGDRLARHELCAQEEDVTRNRTDHRPPERKIRGLRERLLCRAPSGVQKDCSNPRESLHMVDTPDGEGMVHHRESKRIKAGVPTGKGSSKLNDAEGLLMVIHSQARMEMKRETLHLALSTPAQGEECSIGMTPIDEYRLEFLPPETAQYVVEEEPQLTKATVVACGHSFSALALLYHFARNNMTCPMCRHGHASERMGLDSMPAHLRRSMKSHLDELKSKDRQELVDEDTLSVLNILENEVNAEVFMRAGRQVLILYAYAGADSFSPLLVQEIALELSLAEGTLRFSSYTSSVRELVRNLRTIPVPLRHFELVVATRHMPGGSHALARSTRFELVHGTRVVQCIGEDTGGPMLLQVTALNGGGPLELAQVSLTMPSHLLHTAAVRNAEPTFQILHTDILPGYRERAAG